MNNDSHSFIRKFANTFESLSCKIVQKLYEEENILLSTQTKKTHDKGIDSIIIYKNERITVEAKLRNSEIALALKDIATSILFYLLRINDAHYIVTNVRITEGTIDVINGLNEKTACNIITLSDQTVINILKELLPELSGKEKKLANYIIDNPPRVLSKKKEVLKNINENNKLLATLEKQRNIVNSLLVRRQKCIVFIGEYGTGKSTILKMINTSSKNSVFVDCQKCNTIETFIYEFTNSLVGIDVMLLIESFHIHSKTLTKLKSESRLPIDTLDSLIQVLRKEEYNDNICFVAREYLNSLLESVHINVYVIIENFSAASPELQHFIYTYVISSTGHIQFVLSLDGNIYQFKELQQILINPINNDIFKLISFERLPFEDIEEYLISINKDLDYNNITTLYEYFGSNLHLLKMAADELKYSQIKNAENLKPYSYEKVVEITIRKYLYSNNSFYLHAFLISWICSSKKNAILNYYNEDINTIEILLKTNLYTIYNGFLSLANVCVYRCLNRIITEEYSTLRLRVEKLFLCELKKYGLTEIETIRLNFFFNDPNFESFVSDANKIFENRLEYSNIVESKYLIYKYYQNSDDTTKAYVASDLLYEIANNNICIENLVEVETCANTLVTRLQENKSSLCRDDNQRSITAFIKYHIYLYFKCKRNNDFAAAMLNISKCEQYLKYCHEKILIGKVIRFIAIGIKENGDKKQFFDFLKANNKRYSDNEYIIATYKANKAARICYQDSKKALDLLKTIDYEKLNSIDRYIVLWLFNDKLIYSYYANQEISKLNDLFAKIVNKATKLNATTDIARAYNTMGVICYKNDDIEAKEYFKKAVYKIIHYEINNILFYFAINYLQMLEQSDSEFDRIVNILFDWCIKNSDYINSKIIDTNTSLSDNKLFVSIKTFLNLLDNKDDRLLLLLKNAVFLSIYNNNTMPNIRFRMGAKTFILF